MKNIEKISPTILIENQPKEKYFKFKKEEINGKIRVGAISGLLSVISATRAYFNFNSEPIEYFDVATFSAFALSFGYFCYGMVKDALKTKKEVKNLEESIKKVEKSVYRIRNVDYKKN